MEDFFTYKDRELLIIYKQDEKPVPSDFIMHTHDLYELYYFIGGGGIYRVEGMSYPLERGDILIMRPAEAHCIDVNESKPYTRLSINFSPELLTNIDREGRLLRPFNERKMGMFNRYRAENFKSDAYRIFLKNITAPCSDRRVQAITNLLPLLNEISEAFESVTETEADKSTESSIVNYINRHLSEIITLDSICERFYISKPHLCRIFKKATASTVGEYITVKRLVKARGLILSGTPPTQAYLQCGFRDYSVFFRAYKKKYGVPPSNAEFVMNNE